MASTKMLDIEEENLKNTRNYDKNMIKNNNNILNTNCNKCNSVDNSNLDVNANAAKSDIQEFFKGKNVLITGATGFLGKILVEKLLRSCPGVENLYLLVRQKRGKDIYTRIDEIFEDPVFDRLKQEEPKFRHKVVVVPADCEAVGLGLTLSDRQMLTEKVNIIFHSAATVKFDEHLRAALVTNVLAPLHLLRLARDMKGLDVFMHISTAYSNSHLPKIEERFYSCATDCDQLHQMVDKLTDKQIDKLLPTILGPWPNTYTFTKALAEKELRVNSSGIPVGIFRPAIVISTAKEPLKCWIDNMYGPTGITAGTVTGILRTVNCDERVTADIVPVDFVVNCLLRAAVSVHCSYKSSPPSEPPIFNYVSSVENRLSWGDYMRQNLRRIDKTPFSNAVWYVSLRLTQSVFLHNIYILFLHLLPAVLMDGLMICLGRKPKMLKVYRKIHKFSGVLSYFCTREIKYCNRRTRELWDGTSEVDRELFPFSMKEIVWDEYFEDYLYGVRRYLFKESDETIAQAKIKWKRLYYLDKIVQFIFSGFVIYCLWSILSIVF